MPIYIHNVSSDESFGLDARFTNNYNNCSVCYDAATRTKFWGFAIVIINWDKFITNVSSTSTSTSSMLACAIVQSCMACVVCALCIMHGQRRPLPTPHVPRVSMLPTARYLPTFA